MAENDVGNVSAMRKALTDVAENLAIHIQCGRFVAPGDHVSFQISEAEAYIRDIRAALDAPPRNCDSYDVEDGAAECMQAIDAAWHEIDTIRATISWMLSPAKGKEEHNG